MDLVTGALGSVVEKLGELLKEEYNLQMGVREKITTLSRDLVSMHAALCKVDEVPLDELDVEAKLWAGDVREMSYDAEDILDKFLVRVQGSKKPKQKWYKTAANNILELFSKSKARHEIAEMIKNIREKANEVAIRRARYTTGDIVAKPAPNNTVDPRLELSNKEVMLVGIEEPSSELISMLRDDVSTKKLKIISIVGFGGLGKTTLAKVVYDKIKPEYDCGAFVSVGRKPDTKKLLWDILRGLDKNRSMDWNILLLSDERQLIQELQDALRGKRYLIVIDDIWELQTWRRIQNAFAEDNNGSGIITTTRKADTITPGMHCHKLEPLPDGIAKRLFYTRLFGGEGECPANHPVEASEKNLRKCGGVPLAILTMASLLEGKSTEYWSHVSNSTRIYGGRDNDQVDVTVRILSLSYYDLPSELKTCLLYLSMYPEDYVIEKHSLIWRWIAEGLIKEKTGTSLFEQGEEYFNQLINRSMIQAVESEWTGIIYGCRVHDMVLDLIRDLSDELNFVTISTDDEGTPSLGRKVRRLAYQNRMMKQTTGMATERSLVSCRCDVKSWILHPSFKLLRVLALERCSGVPRRGWQGLMHLGNLLHLRYLGLRGMFVNYELPEEIKKLKFLQTIELDDFFTGVLPSGVCQLTQLLCLRGGKHTCAPDGLLTKLTSLEELHIRIDKLSDESKGQFMKDLGNLSEARVLWIRGTLNGMVQSELVQSLGKLHKLQHLQLTDFYYGGGTRESGEWGTLEPLCISPAHLPCLCRLLLRVDHLDEAGLRALGGLPELRRLWLRTRQPSIAASTATVTAGDGFFPKLRYCSLYGWMVQLVLNSEDSTAGVSFTIWNGKGAMPFAFGYRTTDADEHVVSSRWSAAPPPVMPNLQKLTFTVPVRALYKQDGNGGCDNLGLEFLPSLREVRVYVDCEGATADDVERVKTDLRHAQKLHPNKPKLEIDLLNEDEMMTQSTDQDGKGSGEEQEGEISSAGDEVVATPSC